MCYAQLEIQQAPAASCIKSLAFSSSPPVPALPLAFLCTTSFRYTSLPTMNSNLPKYLSEESDIFPLSDNILSDRLQFVTEVRTCFYCEETSSIALGQIGAGNWGSVWLCRPKCDPRSQSVHEPPKVYDMKVAVKVVHRIPDPTTGARIQSLYVLTMCKLFDA